MNKKKVDKGDSWVLLENRGKVFGKYCDELIGKIFLGHKRNGSCHPNRIWQPGLKLNVIQTSVWSLVIPVDKVICWKKLNNAEAIPQPVNYAKTSTTALKECITRLMSVGCIYLRTWWVSYKEWPMPVPLLAIKASIVQKCDKRCGDGQPPSSYLCLSYQQVSTSASPQKECR